VFLAVSFADWIVWFSTGLVVLLGLLMHKRG